MRLSRLHVLERDRIRRALFRLCCGRAPRIESRDEQPAPEHWRPEGAFCPVPSLACSTWFWATPSAPSRPPWWPSSSGGGSDGKASAGCSLRFRSSRDETSASPGLSARPLKSRHKTTSVLISQIGPPSVRRIRRYRARRIGRSRQSTRASCVTGGVGPPSPDRSTGPFAWIRSSVIPTPTPSAAPGNARFWLAVPRETRPRGIAPRPISRWVYGTGQPVPVSGRMLPEAFLSHREPTIFESFPRSPGLNRRGFRFLLE